MFLVDSREGVNESWRSGRLWISSPRLELAQSSKQGSSDPINPKTQQKTSRNFFLPFTAQSMDGSCHTALLHYTFTNFVFPLSLPGVTSTFPSVLGWPRILNVHQAPVCQFLHLNFEIFYEVFLECMLCICLLPGKPAKYKC